MAEDNNKIITRIQNRRGLKQDLPKPLRPGEIGFATDTRQIYIGADTSVVSDSYNKVAKFESGLSISAESVTRSLSNVQMIQFRVPHKRFPRNTFDGTVDSVSWTPTSNAIQGDSSIGPVFATGETVFTDISTNVAFGNESMRVVKNGTVINADTTGGGSHNNISSGADYFFSAAGTTNSDVHKLSFRTRPTNKDEIGITYYGNADVWSAIDSNLNDINPSQPTGVPPFHVRLDSEWNSSNGTTSRLQHRFLNQKNIVLSSSTGVGYIGLSSKHIIVATEVLHPPAEVTQWPQQVNNPLGTLYLSRNRTISSSSPLTANSSTGYYDITLNEIDESNFSSSGGYLNSNLVSTTGWIDGKVLPYTMTGNVLTVNTNGNVGFIGRRVSSVDTTGLFVNTSSGITTSDTVYVYDPNGATGQNTNTLTISSIEGDKIVVGTTLTANSSIDTDVFVIVYKGGSSANILIDETNHGYNGSNVELTGGPNSLSGTFATHKITENAFSCNVTSSGVTVTSPGNVTLTPEVSAADVYVTPVDSLDVSGNVSLDTVVTHFNENINRFKMNYVPGTINKVYITETESESKLSSGFRIYDDANVTFSNYLKITPDNYTRDNSTIKSKLENWLIDVQNADTNLFTELAVNEFYSDTARTSPKYKSGGWQFSGIDSTLKEVSFDSSEEARNFTKVLNNIYFDSESPEVKGLLNVKTNIEILTLETQEAGTADTIYSAPEAFTILPGGSNPVVSNLTFDVTRYDTIFLEYALVDSDSDADPNTNYKRIGSLLASADIRNNGVLLNDTYTDFTANTVGNVNITGSVIPDGSGNYQLQLQFSNTLVPSTELQMTYIKRSWDSAG